jgi:hypothetical protein
MIGNHPPRRRIGCARVSTFGQTLDAGIQPGDVVTVTRIDRLARSGLIDSVCGERVLGL